MVAESTGGRNGAPSGGGDTDGADDVGLAAAHAASDWEHDEPVTGHEPVHDLARLFETHADLQGEARRAQAALVTGEHAAQARRHRLRPIGRAQTRRPEAIQAPLVETLIGESPRYRLPGTQLLATYCASLVTNA